MERAFSMEDRIRKAEEIYLRRNNLKEFNTNEGTNKSNLTNKLIKKFTIQTFASACIFTAVFTFLNNEVYSEKIVNVTKGLLTYNIDFKGMYSYCINMEKNIIKEQTDDSSNEIVENTVAEKNMGGEDLETQESLSNEENLVLDEANNKEEIGSKDEMTINAEYVKENVALINPLEGVITSRFGLRENVKPYNHTGIDIAANTGTSIIASMDGIAEVVSEEGSYGKHIKIVNGEVSTLYAHCSKLLVNEGDYIKQGEKIAEVGSTGNATGPHLHFEIMRNGEYIDPDLILKF